MKSEKSKELFIEQLRRLPIVQVVCEKVGIARSTFYRWRDEDDDFREKIEAALAEGEEFINDMSESQLISLIKEGSYSAIAFWLRHRNPKFRERLEIDATVQAPQQLTPEQESTVRQALQLAELIPEPKQLINLNKHENDTTKLSIENTQ
jgi:hypothetical protein